MTRDVSEVKVNSILYESARRHLSNHLSAVQVTLEAVTGAYRGKVIDYACPRCGKSEGYFFWDKTGCMYFCGDQKCLQDDSLRSKGKRETISIGAKDAAIMFGVGDRYVNANLTRWNANQKNSIAVVEWLRKPKNMLVITGAVRTGKTYFCMAVANYLLDAQRSVKYLLYRRLFDDCKKAIDKDESVSEILEKFAMADFLIIDDVGASQNTDWQKEIFLDLIDRRYSSQKPTVITSNLNSLMTEKELGERTSRRIFDRDNIVITLGDEYVR